LKTIAGLKMTKFLGISLVKNSIFTCFPSLFSYTNDAMKKLYCKKCNKFMGEIEKGAIRNGAAILCETCMDALEKCEAAMKFGKLADSTQGFGGLGNNNFMDDLGKMFGGKN